MVKLNQLASNFFNSTDLPLNMSEEDEKHFNQTNICWLCDGEFSEPTFNEANPECPCKYPCIGAAFECPQARYEEEDRANHEGSRTKVPDHENLTGKYRGPAHNKCNLNCRKEKQMFIPIYFHNFSGYDCHVFFEPLFKVGYKLGLMGKSIDNNILAKTMEIM